MMRIEIVAARGCFTIFALTTGIAIAMAQSSKLPNPADPGAVVAFVKYKSAFSDYQPFREQKSDSWKQVNKKVADNPGMASMHSMKDMPGKTMPDMDSKTAGEPIKEDAGGHDTDPMKDMPEQSMPGMNKQAATAPKNKKEGHAGHDMDSMKDMPDKAVPRMDSKSADEPMSKRDHDAMTKTKPLTATGQSAKSQTAGITGTGIVQGIDKANGKVKLTHDPIAALGWPKMTMFFRLKDSALADQVKEGDKVEFTLEKSGSGYVISGFQKGAARHDMKQMKK